MLTFVTWKWTPEIGYRSTYPAKTVNVLKSMVDRWYQHPHRFVCVTDDGDGIDSSVEIIPAWNDYAHLQSPHGNRNPACYRRLRMFHPEIEKFFGPRFVSMDLDVVITGDLTPLFHRPEEFVAWGDTNNLPGSHYNGSLILMTAGARSQVWTKFDPMKSPREALKAGCWGSDQGFISYCLGPGEARWSTADGVYSFRNHIRKSMKLPENARLVSFHGRVDPWSSEGQGIDWVRKHWSEDITCAA
jgi:hypothetical protein